MRNEPLLSWQWRLYRDGHHDRRNLALHLVTQPLFAAGLLALTLGPLLAPWWSAPLGLAAMLLAVAVQGAGHRRERTPPAPFSGPLDFVARFFAEQLITFPRFVCSGELGRAWRRAS